MDIKIMDSAYPPTMQTFQMLRLICPFCRKDVQFIAPEEDRMYEADAEYWKKRAEAMYKENKMLRKALELFQQMK